MNLLNLLVALFAAVLMMRLVRISIIPKHVPMRKLPIQVASTSSRSSKLIPLSSKPVSPIKRYPGSRRPRPFTRAITDEEFDGHDDSFDGFRRGNDATIRSFISKIESEIQKGGLFADKVMALYSSLFEFQRLGLEKLGTPELEYLLLVLSGVKLFELQAFDVFKVLKEREFNDDNLQYAFIHACYSGSNFLLTYLCPYVEVSVRVSPLRALPPIPIPVHNITVKSFEGSNLAVARFFGADQVRVRFGNFHKLPEFLPIHELALYWFSDGDLPSVRYNPPRELPPISIYVRNAIVRSFKGSDLAQAISLAAYYNDHKLFDELLNAAGNDKDILNEALGLFRGPEHIKSYMEKLEEAIVGN